MGTTANFTDDDDEYYVYEASYAYPVNDGMTITPVSTLQNLMLVIQLV